MASTATHRGAAAALAITILLAGCAGGDSNRGQGSVPTSRSPGSTIEVTETEYGLDARPRDGLIPGRYTFVVKNDGEETHAFAISGAGADERTPPVSGGESVELAVNLVPGRYELWCPVGDHRDRGMHTALLVEGL